MQKKTLIHNEDYSDYSLFYCFQGDGEGNHELRKFFLADPNIFPPKLDYQSSWYFLFYLVIV